MATKISIDKIAVPADIKLVNRQRILETFMNGEKQTIAAIHAVTGISKPTTMRALQYFCQRGILKSAGMRATMPTAEDAPSILSLRMKEKSLPSPCGRTLLRLRWRIWWVRRYSP